MIEKIIEIVLSGLRGIFEQHKELMLKKERASNVDVAAMCTPGVVAVVPMGTGLRDQEMQLLGMASAFFFFIESMSEKGLLDTVKDRRGIATELRKLNSEFPANQIRDSLEQVANRLAK